MSTASLRERKKLRTHRAIQRAAMELFAERGYHATTIAAIAAAADVAPRTVSVHFPAKEDLLFADEVAFGLLAERLEHRRPGETALDALRGWIAETLAADDLDATDELRTAWRRARTRRAIIDADASLRQLEHANHARLERLFAGAVARDVGQTADDLVPQMAAAAAVAVFAVIERTPPAGPDGAPGVAEALALVDLAIRFLRRGLDSVRS